MFERLSFNLSNLMVKEAIIPEDEKEIYVYGLEGLISEVLQFAGIFLIAYLLGLLEYAVIYCIGFCALKRYIGGYHAKSRTMCMIISTLMTITASIIAKFSPTELTVYYAPATVFLTWLIIRIKGPVFHPNNPKTPKQAERNMKKSRYIIGLLAVSMIVVFYVGQYYNLFFSVSLGCFFAAMTLLVTSPMPK